MKQIEEIIKKILKPFSYNKYGKTYIGEKETEGCIRIEGLIMTMGRELKDFYSQTRKECYDEMREMIESKIKYWHIRWEKSDDFDKNIEAKKFNEEFTELSNGILKDILYELNQQLDNKEGK